MPRRRTLEEFIADARKVHGAKYDYSKVDYQGNSNKVIIICKEHGEFLKAPDKHLRGQGCRICRGYIELNQSTFEERSKKTHGGKYDYSKTIVKSKRDKVEIICPEHGTFLQLPGNHISGQGCPDCGQIQRTVKQRYSVEDFIKSVSNAHGNKYDYSNVNYVNSQTKVEIICHEHGPFKMKPNSHFNGQGCPKCGRIAANKNIALDYSKFLLRAKKVHSNRYEYLESSYKNYTSKMKMFCSEHGFFEQTPHSHISMKSGCPKCGVIKTAESNQKGWKVVHAMFRNVHGARYTYNEMSYSDVSTKMKVKCSKHGWFYQKPYQHYGGSGCSKCAVEEVHEKQKIGFDEFKRRSRKIHGNRFNYDESSYVDIFTSTKIECLQHGSFDQKPRDHYRGSGCPKCNSSRGEGSIRRILKELNLVFEEQKSFENLVHKSKLRCDFYLPRLNCVIEFNGLQHYEPISVFGGAEGLRKTQKRDMIKYEYLLKHEITLIVVRYDVENIKEYIIGHLSETGSSIK